MARATLAELEKLQKRIEQLEISLDLETNRADRATKTLRALYTFADISALDDSDVDSVELENEVCAILGYR